MNELQMEDVRMSCKEAAHARAWPEARELAREEANGRGLRGKARDELFAERHFHYYGELKEKYYAELMDGAK